MNKIKLLVCALLVTVGSLQAQDHSKIGVRLGGNFSKMRGVSSGYKLGLTADAFMLFDLSENFKLQTELGYSNIGSKLKDGNKNIRLHYINLAPVIAKIYLTDRFNLEAGTKVSYLVGAKNISKSDLKKLDFGITAGLAYLITDNIEINARYNLGLRNISKVDKTTMKNSGFQAGISVRF